MKRFNRTIAEDPSPRSCGGCGLQLRESDPPAQSLHPADLHRPHAGIENATPYERFYHDPVPLRFPDERVFQEAFFAFYQRKVSADLTISLGNTHYEVPGGYANRTQMIRKNLLDGTVEMIHEDRYLALKPVDLYANARRTATPAQPPTEETDAPLPPSSALLRFAGDFAPIVDSQGREIMSSIRDLLSRFGLAPPSRGSSARSIASALSPTKSLSNTCAASWKSACPQPSSPLLDTAKPRYFAPSMTAFPLAVIAAPI